ncbi:MAG: DUF2695 domain-containing protein [Armatimonadetes bacterium]|nr:DUF2695 domain-containing protein [Armatimonadota bacterium]
MGNREEKKRRQALVEQMTQGELAEAEALMPISKPDLKALFDYVDDRLQQDGCDNTLESTRAFLTQRQLPTEPILDWLVEQGGSCDCEVIANAEGSWGEVVGSQ